MKTFRKVVMPVAVSALALAQPISAAAPVARAAGHTQTSEKLAGHSGNALIIVLVFGGLLALFAATGLFGHGDLPQSP
jgi:hypothetical protein